MDIQEGLLLWLTHFFDKNSTGNGVNMHANKSASNNELSSDLPEEWHKRIIRTFKKRQFILDSKTIFGMLI